MNFEFKKSVYFTASRRDEKMLEEEFRVREKFGFSVEMLDKNKLKELGLNARAAIQS